MLHERDERTETERRTTKGCFQGRGFSNIEMILEIVPRGASYPRDSQKSYQRHRLSRRVIVFD